MTVVNDLESSFDDPKEFATARRFISDFFDVLANDNSYRKEILNEMINDVYKNKSRYYFKDRYSYTSSTIYQ